MGRVIATRARSSFQTPAQGSRAAAPVALMLALLACATVIAGCSRRQTLAIHVAAAHGDLHAVREILAKEPGLVNAPNDGGWTPLHFASRWGDSAVVACLLDHGADPDRRTDQGKETPLHLAATHSASIARLLLDHAA